MSDKCESCGVPWADHLGQQGLCAKLILAEQDAAVARAERDVALRDYRLLREAVVEEARAQTRFIRLHPFCCGCRVCKALAALDAGEGDVPARYYICKGVVGNCAMWWVKDGKGYHPDVSKAQSFTLEETRAHCCPGMTIWPKKYIDGIREAHVDTQDMDRGKRVNAPAPSEVPA